MQKLCVIYAIISIYIKAHYISLISYSLDAALSWIATHEKKFEMNQMYELAITNKQSGTIYGAVGISHDQENKHGEIGYWIGEKYWGNGYATEAAKAIIEFVFNEKGFHRVYGRILRTNPGSGEVLKKCGMTYEGTLKDHIYKHDAFHDVVLYGRIRLLD